MIKPFCDNCGVELHLAMESFNDETTSAEELVEGIICKPCDDIEEANV